MTSYPITYSEIVIWLIFITFNTEDYWTRFLMKWFGVLLGIWTALLTFNGEWWLDDNNSAFTLTQFKDGFQLPLALILLGASIVLMFMLVLSLAQEDWKKSQTSDDK